MRFWNCITCWRPKPKSISCLKRRPHNRVAASPMVDVRSVSRSVSHLWKISLMKIKRNNIKHTVRYSIKATPYGDDQYEQFHMQEISGATRHQHSDRTECRWCCMSGPRSYLRGSMHFRHVRSGELHKCTQRLVIHVFLHIPQVGTRSGLHRERTDSTCQKTLQNRRWCQTIFVRVFRLGKPCMHSAVKMTVRGLQI